MTEIAKKCNNTPSYATIKRWVTTEKKDRQKRLTISKIERSNRGRPRIFSNSELIQMRTAAERMLDAGEAVTRLKLLKAIGRDKGPHKVSVQRVSDYRHLL